MSTLTLVTGLPGAGKTLFTVWELARGVPGSTVPGGDGVPVPRRLCSNIKRLALDHEVIDAALLQSWPDWAKPGDVIVFDEVQEVWRPRTMGTRPDVAVARLETHRHDGVEFVLMTQDPMLLDANVRRLVTRHFHLRRITGGSSFIYEFDHATPVDRLKGAIRSRVWFHPKAAYSLYRSASLHTRQVSRLPRVAYVIPFALAGLAYAGYGVVERVQGRGNPAVAGPAPAASVPRVVRDFSSVTPLSPSLPASAAPSAVLAVPGGGSGVPAVRSELAGCVSAAGVCRCVDARGLRVPADLELCDAGQRGPALDLRSVFPDPVALLADRPAGAGDVEVLSWMARGKTR